MTGRWAPAAMPRIRGQLVAAHQAAGRALATAPADHPAHDARDRLRPLAERLRIASLWWVTSDMAAVAMDAARSLEPWTPHDVYPMDTGLLIWDGGLGPWPDWQGKNGEAVGEAAVDAVWWRMDERALVVSICCRSDRIAEHLTDTWAGSPLMPMQDVWLTRHRPSDTAGQPAHVDGLVATLGATWILQAQEQLASARVESHRAGSRRADRRGHTSREPVTIVDLRHRRIDHPDPTEEKTDRVYTRRWIVSGHWRDQPYGPGRARRRRTWIAPYVKGPDGAPLITATRVHVWRR